jgi:hypothetical protein
MTPTVRAYVVQADAVLRATLGDRDVTLDPGLPLTRWQAYLWTLLARDGLASLPTKLPQVLRETPGLTTQAVDAYIAQTMVPVLDADR